MDSRVLNRLNSLMKLWGNEYPYEVNNMTMRLILRSSDSKLKYLKNAVQAFINSLNEKDKPLFLDNSITSNIQILLNSMQTGQTLSQAQPIVKTVSESTPRQRGRQENSAVAHIDTIRDRTVRKKSIERTVSNQVYDTALKTAVEKVDEVPKVVDLGIPYNTDKKWEYREGKTNVETVPVWRRAMYNFENTDSNIRIAERNVPFVNVTNLDGSTAVRPAVRQFDVFFNPNIMNSDFSVDSIENQYNYLFQAAIDDISRKIAGRRGVMICEICYKDGTVAPVSEGTIAQISQGIITRDKIELSVREMFERLAEMYPASGDDAGFQFDPNFMYISIVLLSGDVEGENYSLYIKTLIEATKMYSNPSIYIPKNNDNKCLIHCLYYYFTETMNNDISFEDFESTIHGHDDIEKINNFCKDNNTQAIILKNIVEEFHPVILGQCETDKYRSIGNYCRNFCIDKEKFFKKQSDDDDVDKYDELERTLFLVLVEGIENNHWITGKSTIMTQNHILRYKKKEKRYVITNGKFKAEKCKNCHQWKREEVHKCLCKSCGQYIKEGKFYVHHEQCRVTFKQKTIRKLIYGRRRNDIDESEEIIEPYYNIATSAFEMSIKKVLNDEEKEVYEPSSLMLKGEYFDIFVEDENKNTLIKKLLYELEKFKIRYLIDKKKMKYRITDFYFFNLDAMKVENYILQNIIFANVKSNNIRVDKNVTYAEIEYEGKKITFGIRYMAEGKMIKRLTLTFGNLHFNFCDLCLYSKITYEDIAKNFGCTVGKKLIDEDNKEQMKINCDISIMVAKSIGITFTNISNSKICLFNKLTFAGASQNMFFDFIQGNNDVSFSHNNHYKNNDIAECKYIEKQLLEQEGKKYHVSSCKYEGCNNRLCLNYNKQGFDQWKVGKIGNYLSKCKAIKILKNYQPYMKDCRSCIVGGRNEIKKHVCNDVKSIDQNSAYPYVMSTYEFPVGYETIDIIDDKKDKYSESIHKKGFNYCGKGIYCVDVLPPNKLDFPVLPMIVNRKIMFGLCRTCCEECCDMCIHTEEERIINKQEYTHVELEKAIEKGYIIKNVYYIRRYDRWVTGPMRKYNRILYLMKQISRCKSEYDFSSLCDENNDIVTGENENTFIDCYDKKETYGPMAKSLLNNQWGRLAMQNQEIINRMFSTAEYVQLCCDKKISVKQLNHYQLFDGNFILINYNQEVYENVVGTHFGFASYVLSYGRLELLKKLEEIGEAVCYYDTDSVTFDCQKFDICKLKLGSNLGEWKDEHPELKNVRFAAVIPRMYIKTSGDKIVSLKVSGMKCKKNFGESEIEYNMRMFETYNIVVFSRWIEALKANNVDDIDADTDRRIMYMTINEDVLRRNQKTGEITIVNQNKSFRMRTLKRRILDNNSTIAFGSK